jgi:plasmid stabilization system protein ParE
MRYTLVDWEPWQSAGMHKLPVDHYVVYYAIDADSQTVAIIRIFYSGRDVKSIITADED